MNTEQKNVNGKSKTSKKIINSCFSQTSPLIRFVDDKNVSKLTCMMSKWGVNEEKNGKKADKEHHKNGMK